MRASGAEITADYETFKAIYDASPMIQGMVKNFNDSGIELKVPGAPDDKNSPGTQDSAAEIDKMASSAADQQVAQNQATPQVTTQGWHPLPF